MARGGHAETTMKPNRRRLSQAQDPLAGQTRRWRASPRETPEASPPNPRSGREPRVCSRTAFPPHAAIGEAVVLGILLVFSAFGPAARAAVTFTVQFEPGSKWYTESWSDAARAEMQAFFADLGGIFVGTANVLVEVNDDETEAYASAGATWRTRVEVEGRTGSFWAPSVWSILVKGVDENGPEPDVKINWNLDVAGLYRGSPAPMIGNFRGLGRHEMHHPFGSASMLYQSPTYDPRGRTSFAALIDSFYRDANDAPVMGEYNAHTGQFTVNQYRLAEDWARASNQSGLYFEARNIRGEVVKMPPISSNGRMDFSHVTGIAYVGDHPSWTNYEDTDRNFLRALGYPLAADASLRASAPIVDFRRAASTAEVTCTTRSTHSYRLSTSADLVHWFVRPKGLQGTGANVKLTVPALDPVQFYRVVEVP